MSTPDSTTTTVTTVTPTVICDNGSGFSKVGLNSNPLSMVDTFPTIVGHLRKQLIEILPEKHYIGLEAMNMRGRLDLVHPIERGVVTNWDRMERLWLHTLQPYDPRTHPFILTVSPSAQRDTRERTASFLFESLGAQACHIGLDATLSLMSAGRETGLILNIGEDSTHAVPIVENVVNRDAVRKEDFGGKALTEGLRRLVGLDGYHFTGVGEFEVVRNLKEQACFVTLDDDRNVSSGGVSVGATYELPDGSPIVIDGPRFRCPEVLFHPHLPHLSMDVPGIHRMVESSICDMAVLGSGVATATDDAVKSELHKNVVLCGGSALLKGLPERLEKELSVYMGDRFGNAKVVLAMEQPQYSAWMGGAMLSSLSTFKDRCMTAKEYEEVGPNIANMKT